MSPTDTSATPFLCPLFGNGTFLFSCHENALGISIQTHHAGEEMLSVQSIYLNVLYKMTRGPLTCAHAGFAM